jgi:hypothetical protein
MRLILQRRDDPTHRIELVRWQKWLHGTWGYTAAMIVNRRTPALFLKSVWKVIEEGK